MNILFSEKTFALFNDMELDTLSKYLLYLEKFQVQSVSVYLESLDSLIKSNLKSLNIKAHFNLLYTQTKLNIELVPLKSPLYITFLLKINENFFEKEKEINPINLAWTLAYYSYLDHSSSIILEESFKNMIDSLRKNSDWINSNTIEEILDIIIMIDNMKLFDVKIPKFILEFFDKEIIANLLEHHINYNFDNPGKRKVLDLLSSLQNLKIVVNKLTNVFYVDALVESSDKVISLFFINIFIKLINK